MHIITEHSYNTPHYTILQLDDFDNCNLICMLCKNNFVFLFALRLNRSVWTWHTWKPDDILFILKEQLRNIDCKISLVINLGDARLCLINKRDFILQWYSKECVSVIKHSHNTFHLSLNSL